MNSFWISFWFLLWSRRRPGPLKKKRPAAGIYTLPVRPPWVRSILKQRGRGDGFQWANDALLGWSSQLKQQCSSGATTRSRVASIWTLIFPPLILCGVPKIELVDLRDTESSPITVQIPDPRKSKTQIWDLNTHASKIVKKGPTLIFFWKIPDSTWDSPAGKNTHQVVQKAFMLPFFAFGFPKSQDSFSRELFRTWYNYFKMK